MERLLVIIGLFFVSGMLTVHAQKIDVNVSVSTQKTIDVSVVLVKNINEASTKLEQQATVVSDDVYDDKGRILIAAGSPVILDIQYEEHKGVGKPGYVSIKPISTTDVYGKIIKLNGEGKSKTGESKRGVAIGCGVFFGIVLCPIGLLFLCIKGENPEIPKGTLMMATATLN